MTAKAGKPKAESTKKKGRGGSGSNAPKAKAVQASATAASRRNGHVKRLRPGELDGLVLSFMRKHEKDLPLSASAIAKGIGRSAGAVGNCLERLASAKKARLANKAPREYDLKGVGSR
ncbi:MAG TPA: hypothetical protein VF731_05350 [Solirubrobacterales bacterium]